jgi:hypothetical protein
MDSKTKAIVKFLALDQNQIALAMVAIGDAGECVKVRICSGKKRKVE